jgi:hypothetical protein
MGHHTQESKKHLTAQPSKSIHWSEGHALQLCLDQCSAAYELMIMTYPISIGPAFPPLMRSCERSWQYRPKRCVLIDSYLTTCASRDLQRTVVSLNKVRMDVGSALLYLSFYTSLSNMLCSLDDRPSICTGIIPC